MLDWDAIRRHELHLTPRRLIEGLVAIAGVRVSGFPSIRGTGEGVGRASGQGRFSRGRLSLPG